jgi:hypothetical protein
MDSSLPDAIAPEAYAEPVVQCPCAYAYQREYLSSSGQAYPLEVTDMMPGARSTAARSRPVSDAPARGARPGSPVSNPHKTTAFSRHTSFFLDHGCARVHTHGHAHDDDSRRPDDGWPSSLDAAPLASAGTRAVSWHVPRSRVGRDRAGVAPEDGDGDHQERTHVPGLSRDGDRVLVAAGGVLGVLGARNRIEELRRTDYEEQH